MYQSAAILFFVCFCCYILFTRQPDYFDAEFTPGKIVWLDTADHPSKAIQYPVEKEKFTLPVDGWGASQVSEGDAVNIIYNPTVPSEGSLYTFFGYWLKLPELLIGIVVFIALFVSAIFITGKNEEEVEVPVGSYLKKKKYKD